jgi:hypothetical protein
MGTDIIACPECGAKLRFKSDRPKRLTCPRCKTTFKAPVPAEGLSPEVETVAPEDAVPSKGKKKNVDGLSRVAVGLWLAVAGMIVQVLVACVALGQLISQFGLATILDVFRNDLTYTLLLAMAEPTILMFRVATLLPVALQIAGHFLCLSTPDQVRIGRQSGRGFIAFILILDVLGLLLLGWSLAAGFAQLGPLPEWASPPSVVLVPIVFIEFAIALSWYIDRAYLGWWGRSIQVLGVLLVILMVGALLASEGGGARVGVQVPATMVVAGVVGVGGIALLYLAYVGQVFCLALATGSFARQAGGPENRSRRKARRTAKAPANEDE